ncbi:glycosyltransferase family 2 protein [Candidatus Woesearchaeota archaeon]|nr:glycosyltransferase family 2 protein [Candidatus Woesearchaeota archaeon]
MSVSIIIPAYNPNEEILSKIIRQISKQKFEEEKEVIIIDDCSPKRINKIARAKLVRNKKNLGLADAINTGVKLAKHEIVVVVEQDALPVTDDWLKKLVEPFKDEEVVATASTLILPEEIWQKFDNKAKILTANERGTHTPLLDETACAYRKAALKKAGFFDSTNFRTAGEDFDMYIKLKKIGKISYPKAGVYHMHPTNYATRMGKEAQLSEGFGALVRIHGAKMPRWYLGVLKATPLVGWLIFLLTFPYQKISFKLAFPTIIWLSAIRHWIYVENFWKGFINKKQTI